VEVDGALEALIPLLLQRFGAGDGGRAGEVAGAPATGLVLVAAAERQDDVLVAVAAPAGAPARFLGLTDGAELLLRVPAERKLPAGSEELVLLLPDLLRGLLSLGVSLRTAGLPCGHDARP